MKTLFTLAAICFAIACTDDDSTRKTLQMHGFTNVQTTGYSPFTCGDNDSFSTGFRATNPSGQVVEGTVCCGLFGKGCTVRF